MEDRLIRNQLVSRCRENSIDRSDWSARVRWLSVLEVRLSEDPYLKLPRNRGHEYQKTIARRV